ncbi:MAG: hypothetical protein ACLRZF_15455 [Waltera sp.]
MLIMAAACGASGYFFVNYVFQTSMERETRQALDESSILRFAFETAALNIPEIRCPSGRNSRHRSEHTWRTVDSTASDCCGSAMRAVGAVCRRRVTGDISLLWENTGRTEMYRVVHRGIPITYPDTDKNHRNPTRLLTLETMKSVTAVSYGEDGRIFGCIVR